MENLCFRSNRGLSNSELNAPDNISIESAKAVSRETIHLKNEQTHENTTCDIHDADISSEETTYGNDPSDKVAQIFHTATVDLPNDYRPADQVIPSDQFKNSNEKCKESIRVIPSEMITVINSQHEGNCNTTFFHPVDFQIVGKEETKCEGRSDNSLSYHSDDGCLTNKAERVKEIAKTASLDFNQEIEMECGVVEPPSIPNSSIQEVIEFPRKVDKLIISCQGRLKMAENPISSQTLVPHQKKRKRRYGKQSPSKKSTVSHTAMCKDKIIAANLSSSAVKRKALVKQCKLNHNYPENFKFSNSPSENKLIQHSSRSWGKETSSAISDPPTFLRGEKFKEYQESACDEFSYVSTLASDIDTSSSTSPPDNESNCTPLPTKDECTYRWKNATLTTSRKEYHSATQLKICESHRPEAIIESFTFSEPRISKEYTKISESHSCQRDFVDELRGKRIM